jgi:hypothetical protein
MPETTAAPSVWRDRWTRFAAGARRAFVAYADWLVSISWRRFIVLSLLLLIFVAILRDLPPFTWTVTENVNEQRSPQSPAPTSPPALEVPIRIEGDKPGGSVDIRIGKEGIVITPRAGADASPTAEAAIVEASKALERAAAAAAERLRDAPAPGTPEAEAREALRGVQSALEDAQKAVREATRAAAGARRDAERSQAQSGVRTTRIGIGDFLMQLTQLWVLGSALLKFAWKGTRQAERRAASAAEVAEAESLRRQVVEARMAAMQAQVEPHFLFNTLASIDHLIETDPLRASQMQRNLIALLRASMPTMRETTGSSSGQGVRDLGREIAVIRPYLEILKVRMEERLTTEIAVPEGLMSAEFPPMMLQTLVENAIKHGLEPKAEGGRLRVAAEVVHGKLQMTVADTGLGFAKADTAGTGVGLANVRERLKLLYGSHASLTVAENRPSGTVVTITVPYKPVERVVA